MSLNEERSKLDQKGPNVITYKGQTDHFAAPLKGLSRTKAILFHDGFLFSLNSTALYAPVEKIFPLLERTIVISHKDLQCCWHGSS